MASPSYVKMPPCSDSARALERHDSGAEDNRDSGTDEGSDNETEGAPVVQFSCSNFYIVEGTDPLQALVWRIGPLDGRTTVLFKTKSASAKADVHYAHTEHTVIFEPGENEQVVQVPIISNMLWGPELEFFLELEQPSPGSQLGRYLKEAVVKIADNNVFPTDKFQAEIEREEFQEIKGMPLLLEYFKLQFSNPIIRVGTIKMMIVDQLHNVYMIMRLFLQVYLLDHILNMHSPTSELILVQDRRTSLYIAMAFMLVPFLCLYFLDYRKTTWKVGGTSVSTLKKALVRRFLHYEGSVRSTFRDSDVLIAILVDVGDLVGNGYNSMIHLVCALGQLLMILAYQLSAPAIFGKPFRLVPLIPFLLFPVCLFIFLQCRKAYTMKCLEEECDTEQEVASNVHATVENYRILLDYKVQAFFVDRFEAKMKDHNKAMSAMSKAFLHNSYFPQCLTILCVAVYTLVGGLQVVEGNQPVGMFVTDVQVIAKIGGEWNAIYQTIMAMYRCGPALQQITELLNKEVDVEHRMQLAQCSSELTRRFREEIKSKGLEGIPLDHMPIKIEKLDFDYGVARSFMAAPSRARSSIIHQSGFVQIDQGQLVALVGHTGEGKSTVLRLLGGAVLQNPPAGDSAGIFVPSHLRVLHVTQEPVFFHETLMKNLTLGVRETSKDARLDRVLAICRKLHVREEVLASLSLEDKQDWATRFSDTQKSLLNLARAFIANFEVICIHKPTQPFAEATSEAVLQLMKEHVRCRGLEQNASKVALRRPRTVFFTSSKLAGVDLADSVFNVSRDQGIQQVEKGEVSAQMLM